MPTKFTLVTKDEQKFEVDRDVLRQCEMLNTMINDLGLEDNPEPIPIPNVDGKTMEKVLTYCEHHKNDPTKAEEDEASTSEPASKQRRTNEEEEPNPSTEAWDKDFMKVEQEVLFDLITAANYLNINGLLNLGCKAIVNSIRGKTAEEIRKMWGITEPFGPKEEKQCRVEMGFTDDEDEEEDNKKKEEKEKKQEEKKKEENKQEPQREEVKEKTKENLVNDINERMKNTGYAL